MSNQVFIAPHFLREAKRLLKKYRSLQTSVDRLIEDLKKDPYLGESYGKNLYKVRLADKSKGSGKSGGFRVMYYQIQITEGGIDVLLISIYDKSERSTIKKDDALKLLSEVLASLHKK